MWKKGGFNFFEPHAARIDLLECKFSLQLHVGGLRYQIEIDWRKRAQNWTPIAGVDRLKMFKDGKKAEEKLKVQLKDRLNRTVELNVW